MEVWVVVGAILERMDREDASQKMKFEGNMGSLKWGDLGDQLFLDQDVSPLLLYLDLLYRDSSCLILG